MKKKDVAFLFILVSVLSLIFGLEFRKSNRSELYENFNKLAVRLDEDYLIERAKTAKLISSYVKNQKNLLYDLSVKTEKIEEKDKKIEELSKKLKLSEILNAQTNFVTVVLTNSVIDNEMCGEIYNTIDIEKILMEKEFTINKYKFENENLKESLEILSRQIVERDEIIKRLSKENIYFPSNIN